MKWLKLDSTGILRGSLSDSEMVTQLIWIKLLCMANETRDRDGYLRYSVGHPYSMEYIAQVCNVTMNQLEIAIDDFMEDIRDGHQRIEFSPDGSIKLNNWLQYQNKPEKDTPTRLVKSAEQIEAITKKCVRHMPEIATEELIKISEEKANVRKIYNDIDIIIDKAKEG
jgi:hypothetical protein